MVVNTFFNNDKHKNILTNMRIFNIKAWCTSLFVALAIVSCNDIVTYDEDYDDGMTSHGVPVINAVYDVEDTELANPLTEADFGDYIMLKGENLSNVTRIVMNDVEVDMTNVYATASTAWLAVPSTAPNEITNKMTYTTELGEAQYDFTVVIPDVTVVGLYNEMAPAGTSVKVLGSYFSLHGFGNKETSKVTMNGTPLEVSDVTDNGMTIAIPTDAQPNSTIDFEWVGTSGQKKASIPYARKQDLIYEDWNSAGLWGTTYLVSNGGDKSVSGSYFRINKSLSAWAYETILGVGSAISVTDDMVANPSNYLFKFEVRSAMDSPFQDTGANSGVNGYCFGLDMESGGTFKNTYEWNPSAGQSFNTYGEWCTIRLEYADLVATVNPSAGKIAFKLTFQPIAAIDADHSFANFRIEKKN